MNRSSRIDRRARAGVLINVFDDIIYIRSRPAANHRRVADDNNSRPLYGNVLFLKAGGGIQSVLWIEQRKQRADDTLFIGIPVWLRRCCSLTREIFKLILAELGNHYRV